MDKKAMYKLTYGLFVLTSASEGTESGCIINTAGQVTSSPNRISITVNKANFTHDLVARRSTDKFSGYTDCARSANGLYYITAGTNSYISAAVEQAVDLGSHTMFLASVNDMEVLSNVPSATYAYYQSSIKPAPEPSASGQKSAWRCSVCGYLYEGDDLPEDFICPLCKHPASDFEKITS